MIACGLNIVGMYHMPEISFFGATTLAGVHVDITGWHHRLSHPSDYVLSKVMNKVPHYGSKSINFCFTYATNKGRRLPFPNCHDTTDAPLDVLHLDLWGPSPVKSRDGFRYYLCRLTITPDLRGLFH